MKTVTVYLLSFLFFFEITNAQFKVLGEGPEFEEPENGYAKILQLKNGTTLLLLISPKNEFTIQVYDSNHKKKGEQNFAAGYGKKNAQVKAVFEINGDMIVFTYSSEDRTPELHRFIINGKTGVLKNETKIAELSRVSFGQGYAIAFGGVPIPNFFIRKDPDSDNYALAMLNSFESDRNRRIEIVHYNSENKEISRAYYKSPDEKYKYLRYLDMAVIGDKKVCVLAYVYNTRASGGKESELFMASLDTGSSAVILDELPFTKDLIISDAVTRYNPLSKKIILLTAAKTKKGSNEYVTYIAYIDPFERKLEYSGPVYPAKANEKSIELFGGHEGYTGMPQNLFINNDGGFSIVYEVIEITTYYAEHYSSNYTDLGNVAVSKFDMSGKEITSYFIPKSQKVFSAAIRPFYHSEREGTAQALGKGNQFKSFAYLSGNLESYVLFNDVEENADRVKKGKITTVQGVGDCNGFYYRLSGNETLPGRDFIFGKPAGSRENNLGLFAISDYDKANNIYVTLKLEKEGKSKNVKIVWLQP